MAMTEEERRIARNEASKRWYAAHKAAKGAKNKTPAAKANVKQGPDLSKLEKDIEKFIGKNEKVTEAFKGLVKSSAEILGDAFKTGDEKLIAKTCKMFGRRLSLEVRPMPEDGKAEISVSVGAKLFRIPKAKPVVIPTAPETDEKPEADEKPKADVVPVDPAVLTGIEDGTVTSADIDAEQEPDDSDDDPDDPDEEEKDPEDMDDDEYKAYLEHQADKDAEDWANGHADMMREMDEQGAYDGFEN